jgi:hypothetical protein
MSNARIVVLSIAPGAGCIAASQAETFVDAPEASTPALALRGKADANAVENISDDQASKRSESANVVQFSIAIQTTAQK